MAADILQDATRAVVRPDEELETAVVKLLDARGTLLELRVRHRSGCCVAALALMRIIAHRPHGASNMP